MGAAPARATVASAMRATSAVAKRVFICVSILQDLAGASGARHAGGNVPVGFSQISRKTVREALDRNSSGDRGTQLLETQREALSQLAVDPATVVVERADRCYGVSGLCPAEREHVDRRPPR